MRLYEISETYRAFIAGVEAGDIPEEAIADTLEALEGAFEEKAEAIGCIIKEQRAESEAIKREEEALSARRKAKENHADSMENYLYRQMKCLGKDKFETARVRVKFTKGEKVEIADELAFVGWAKQEADDLLTFKEPTVNKTAIKAALKAGRVLPGVALEKTEKARVG